MNGKSCDTSNTGYTRYMQKTNKARKHNTTQKTKMMNITDTKEPGGGGSNHAQEQLYYDMYRLFICIANDILLFMYFFLIPKSLKIPKR